MHLEEPGILKAAYLDWPFEGDSSSRIDTTETVARVNTTHIQ